MKRTPLKRTASLTRTPMSRQRTPLAPRSQKRIAAAPSEAAVRGQVFARDRVCVLGPYLGGRRCSPGLTFHHIRKASAGGPYSIENGVALCGTMNTWVEDHPAEAWSLGLVSRRGDSLEECWTRMQSAGLVSYGPNGEPIAPNARRT